MDEHRDLHGAPDLPPDGGDPGGVDHQAVHGHTCQHVSTQDITKWSNTILYDEGRDGDQRQHQHVQNEELLAARGGRVDLVAAHPPYHTVHTLARQKSGERPALVKAKNLFTCVDLYKVSIDSESPGILVSNLIFQ